MYNFIRIILATTVTNRYKHRASFLIEGITNVICKIHTWFNTNKVGLAIITNSWLNSTFQMVIFWAVLFFMQGIIDWDRNLQLSYTCPYQVCACWQLIWMVRLCNMLKESFRLIKDKIVQLLFYFPSRILVHTLHMECGVLLRLCFVTWSSSIFRRRSDFLKKSH